MLALFVSLKIRTGERPAFLEAIERQAEASRSAEPGCLRFDVCAQQDDPNSFVLYELYADEAALEAHRSTPHFAQWREAAGRLVERQINTLTSLIPAGGDARSSVVLRPSELSPVDRGGGASTVYLVDSAAGAETFMNGITTLEPSAGIPLHSHNCEESVVVLEGEALFEDERGAHELSAGDTTLVPRGAIHRFVNRGAGPLRILWTYGSTDATRTIAATGETRPVRSEGMME